MAAVSQCCLQVIRPAYLSYCKAQPYVSGSSPLHWFPWILLHYLTVVRPVLALVIVFCFSGVLQCNYSICRPTDSAGYVFVISSICVQTASLWMNLEDASHARHDSTNSGYNSVYNLLLHLHKNISLIHSM